MRAAPAVLALALLALPVLPLAAPAAPSPPFSDLVCYWELPDVNPERPLERCNLRASARTGPANEIDLAMNPADPLNLVAVAKAYNYTRNLQGAFIGGVFSSFATTFDGGLTWTEGYLQPMSVLADLPVLGPVGSTPSRESDPIVEFATDGSVLAMTLKVNGDDGLPVYRSLDGGATWAPLSKAMDGFNDKEWMVTDPLSGNVYAVALSSDGAGTSFVRSTDLGATWSAEREIVSGRFPGIDVGPNGEVHLATRTGGGFRYTRSTDSGLTWSASRVIATLEDAFQAGPQLFRTPIFPNLAASRTTDDVVLVYHGPAPDLAGLGFGVSNDDVWLARTTDGGLTWAAPVRINMDFDPAAVNFQFMPQVAFSPNGRDLHVAWMDQRHDASGQTVHAYYRHSPDGGATWDPQEIVLTDAPFAADLAHHQSATVGVFVGDYIGLQASDERAVVAFPDTRYGRSDVFIATVV